MKLMKITVAENRRQYSTYEARIADDLAADLSAEFTAYTRSLYLGVMDPRIAEALTGADLVTRVCEPSRTPEYAYEVMPAPSEDPETSPREYALVTETGWEGDREITTWALIRENGVLTAYPFSSANTALHQIITGGLQNMSAATGLFYAALSTRNFDTDMSKPDNGEDRFPFLVWTPMEK